MSLLYLIAGLILLAIAGDALVRGAVAAAARLGIPTLIVGLTIVAMGTSAPELIVSLDAALQGAPGLAIGNVVGSNIANILIVLGLPAIFAPIVLDQPGVRRSAVTVVAVSVLLYALALDGMVSRPDGLILLALLVVYLIYSAIVAGHARRNDQDLKQTGGSAGLRTHTIIVLIVLGVAGLALGGTLTTDGALGLARTLGVSDSAVGLTIVALGTSLPELAASIMAAYRRQHAVAIGNVLGSNVFNTLGIMGLVAGITPLPVAAHILSVDMWVMIGSALLALPFAFYFRRIGRVVGMVMTILYLIYVVTAFAG